MHTTSAETLRGREVYRYYQPRSLFGSGEVERLLPTYPPSPESNNSFSTATNFSAKNFTTQQSFSDTALTAFAQLIAIRLASQRAIVSLIDHENEYFLAESTSTLSLTDNGGLEQNAWLSISGARVPLRESLCEETLKLVPNQDPMIEQTPWYLVPDLQLDERMKNLSCVKQSPHLRFYCGVALANKKGINIGCVYVVDNRPRTDFTLEQAQFLTSMTATIMDHLECIRAKEDIVRVTMMSQALHAFIEGDATMDGDWQRLKRYDLPGGAGVGFSWETKKNDGSGVYANGKKQLGSSCRSTHSRSSSDASRQQSPLQHAGTTQDARFNFNNSPWSSSEEDVKIPVLKSVLQGAEPPNAVLETSEGGRDAEFSNDGFSTLLHLTFSRASNLTREGMEIDGAVFFDAPFRFYQGRSTLQTDTRRSATADSEDVSDEESIADHEEHHDARPGPYPLVQPPNKHAEPTGAMQDSMGLKAEVLGFSTSTSSSLKNQAISPETFSSIDQSLLTALVRRYPKGQLFEFDEQGPISTNEDLQFNSSQTTIVSRDVEVKQIRDRARKRSEILRLLASFPRARHIAFVPLYDSTSGCFIGSFAWSTSATRLFSVDNHLSYLVAFGHSVMSEVGRLNTLSADRAKGDFISNVSHELRSPLHGILASVEFLADTQLDGFQRNLVDTVDICGRTLLDTIEHVLDFSKIKSFGQESSQPLGVVADLDVSAVIEEVLEGVYAGFEFNGLSSQGLADNTRSGVHSFRPSTGTFSTSSSSPTPDQKVIVILDVDFRDQWKFPTAPGTWKRLTMNVFGNALKYTHHGYIKVKVEARPMSALTTTSSILERTMITLTISDSGRGMSSEFMKSKLFMPFSQEDATQPGTGLGMSIVKQIVDLSGGRIDVRSNQQSGTEIKLSLPLQNCISEGESPQSNGATLQQEDPIDAVRRRARGFTFTIQGFRPVSGSSELQAEALLALKESIQKYCTQWFHLSLACGDEEADIAITDESGCLTLSKTQRRWEILLVLCHNSARRDLYPAITNSGQNVEFVSRPCGPHRLAKALLSCLDTKDSSPRRLPPERVSATEPHSGGVPPNTAISNTGKDNTRLIGDLQSSIEFSPAVISLMITPGLQKEPGSGTHQPPITRRISSNSTGSSTSRRSTSSYSGKVMPVNAADIFPGPISPLTSKGEILPSPIGSLNPQRQPKMLLVEDNPVNMMLLATYMKKNQWEHEKATNGLLALQAFRASPQGFDVIFMDVSMPIMTGYEATRHIRAVETERRLAYECQNLIQPSHLTQTGTSFPFNSYASLSSSSATSPAAFDPVKLDEAISAPRLKLGRRALIIALTGFSSQRDQELAFEAGVDIFMTKPVRFREVGKILNGWMRSRELEGMEE